MVYDHAWWPGIVASPSPFWLPPVDDRLDDVGRELDGRPEQCGGVAKPPDVRL
jgi:hypothetical protein